MRFRSGVIRNYYSSMHEKCMLTNAACFKRGYGCEQCRVIEEYYSRLHSRLHAVTIINEPEPVSVEVKPITVQVNQSEPFVDSSEPTLIQAQKAVKMTIEEEKEMQIAHEIKMKALSEETWQRNQAQLKASHKPKPLITHCRTQKKPKQQKKQKKQNKHVWNRLLADLLCLLLGHKWRRIGGWHHCLSNVSERDYTCDRCGKRIHKIEPAN